MTRFWHLWVVSFFVPSLAFAQSAIPQTSTAKVEMPDAWLQVESFGGGNYRASGDSDLNEFELGRAELGAGFREAGMGGLTLNLEVVRSASPESLFGVDGNSLIARAKHAFAFADPSIGPGTLRVAVGLIQDPWISMLESGYRIRAMRPTASESSQLFDTSDLGLSLGYSLWDGFAELTLAWTNGEGRNQSETNTGKNATVVASLRPLHTNLFDSDAVLGFHFVWRDGSVGQGFLPNHRLGGALTWTHKRFEVGAEFLRGDGTKRRDLPSQVVSAWVDADIIDHWFGVFAGFDTHNLNSDIEQASVLGLSGGFYTDLIQRKEAFTWRTNMTPKKGLQCLRLALHGRTDTYESQAGALVGVPGLSDVYQINLTAEAAGLLF